MIGQTILHYQVTEKLGEGGMGEVYKARDPRLNRTVAIKALSAHAVGDPERRRRFILEAQAASSLNHPNIITIHDILSDSNTEYMVMEYVAGKTLADLIPAGGLGVEKTLRYGVQIADALAAAHTAGIVHRDLKPGNVMVTASGLVKILDFGLAKITMGQLADGTQLTDETQPLAAPLTIEGAIHGTVSYMSPEQAQGGKIDARSDIFAFGALMYEMATGNKAFPGPTLLAILTAILRDEVKPIRDSVPDCPPELEEIVGRALRKAPADRWQSMEELHGVLRGLRQKFESGMLYLAALAPPANQPPANQPPASQSPASQPPANQPPTIQPSANQLSANQSPAIQPPAIQPPANPWSRWLIPGLIAFGIIVVGIVFAGMGGWLSSRRGVPASAPNPPAVSAPVAHAVPGDKPSPLAQLPKPQTAPRTDGVLTNQSVLELAGAQVPESVIVSQIHASKTQFDLSTAGIIELTKGGVAPAVIEAMRHPSGETVAAPPPAPSAATRMVPLLGGVPFDIALLQEVPADPVPGTALHFQAASDVQIDGAVAIARGAPVTGVVLPPGKKNILGRGGKPVFRLTDVVAVDGTKVKVKASPGRGSDKNGHNIEPPGHRGKESLAPAGTRYLAYFDGDQTVAVKR